MSQTTVVQTSKPKSLPSILLDLYLAPGDAFRAIRRQPFWIPLVGFMIVNLAFTAVWMNKVDPETFIENEIERSGNMGRIPPDQLDNVISQQAGFFEVMGWLGPVVFAPLMLVIVAGVLLFVYRFFYAAELRFGNSFGIVAWTFFAIGLVQSPLILLVLYLKDDWNLNPQIALQANLSLLLDKADASPVLWALMESVDLVSFWMIFLLATGYAVASKKSTGAALWGVVVPWALIVAVKVGFTALTR